MGGVALAQDGTDGETTDLTAESTTPDTSEDGETGSTNPLIAEIQSIIDSSSSDLLIVELADYFAAKCAEGLCTEVTNAALEVAAARDEDGNPNPAAGAIGGALGQVAAASAESNPEFVTAIEEPANLFIRECSELDAEEGAVQLGVCTAVASYSAQLGTNEITTAALEGDDPSDD